MSPLSGSRGHSPVTLIFLPTPPRKPSSESYSSSIGLWITNSISLGSNPNIFKWFIGLWLSYLSPIFSGHLHEYDAEISSYQHALSLLPRSAPTHASDVYYLAMLRLNCYTLSELKQQDDLEQSIIGFTAAILSLPLPQVSPFLFLLRSPGTPKMSSAALSTFAICVDCCTTSIFPFPFLSQQILSVHWCSRWN